MDYQRIWKISWKGGTLSLVLAAFLLFIPFTGVSAQDLELPRLHLSVRAVFSEIERQTDLSVAYDAARLDVRKDVDFVSKNLSVNEAMETVLKGSGLAWKIEGRQILIVEQTVHREQIVYKGTVMDEDNLPVIGANISVGDRTGTFTDLDGHFSLSALPGDRITVSSIGFRTAEVILTEKTVLDIVLAPDTQLLDEIVVVGYGTQKRANVTGAVATISADDLNARPVVSAANALQGADPSMNLTFGTGSPESNYSVNIRGAVSVNSGAPLILADGIEVTLKQINPNDIESVSVLKDASAAAIYGAKASAGVILITTKSGSSTGRPQVSYSGRVGWAQNTTSTDFITTGYDYTVLTNRFYNAYNGVDIYQYPEDNGELQKLLDRRNDKTEQPGRPWVEVGSDGRYYYYGNFDWFNYFYRKTRPQQEHNVSVTGGGEKFNYYVSGRYLQQKGVFRIFGDTYSDVSFRTKMNAEIRPWLRYSNNISYDRTEMTFPGRPQYEQTISSLQSNCAPMFIPHNPDGSIVQYPNQVYSGSPMGTGYAGSIIANNTFNSKVVRYIVISNQIDIDITKDLTLTASYGYRMRDPINRYRNNTFEYSRQLGVYQTFTSGAVANYYVENRYSETQGDADVYATYRHTWKGKHNFTAVVGGQYTDYYYRTMQGQQNDLANDDLASFAVGTGIITLQQTINSLRTLGFFARVNYDYDGRYLFEASTRADGSSRFAEGSRWAMFPSVSLGWRISQEKFFSPVKGWWSDLKLRLSAGSLGNQQMSSYYPYIDRITIDNEMNYTFDDEKLDHYAAVTAPVSSKLTWETVTTYNLGVDMSFFDNRLNLTADFYIRDTKNMLTTSMTLPDVYGATTPKENCANLRTKGYEIYVGWKDSFNLAGRPFTYDISATLGDYVTTITKYNNPDRILSDYYEGMTLGEIWGYHVNGLFSTDEQAAQYQATINDVAVNQRVYNSKGEGAGYLRAGDVWFADLNDDKTISEGANTVDDPGDRRVIGNYLPRYSYSFRLGFDWNNFSVSAFFQGVGKRNWYPAEGQASFDFWGPYAFPATSFIYKDFESLCWSEENTGAYFPRQRGYQAYAGGALAEVNDRYLQNVAYLRLKNITVGYTIPVLKKYVKEISVAFVGENLWYWSPLKKYCKTIDPELALSSSTYKDNTGTGYFYSRTFSLCLNIIF